MKITKKKSNKKLGDEFEKQCKEHLEQEGYTVMRSPRTMRRVFLGKKMIFVSSSNDFYGHYDLCAKKDGKTRWIQCKYGLNNIRPCNWKEMILHHIKNNNPVFETSEVWYNSVEEPKKISVLVYDDLIERLVKKEEK